MRGLHDGGNGNVLLAHAREHAHAIQIGHDQVENEQVDRRPVDRVHARQRRFAQFERLGLVAEPPRHRLQQTALNGVVVDNEDERGHSGSSGMAQAEAVRRADSLTTG